MLDMDEKAIRIAMVKARCPSPVSAEIVRAKPKLLRIDPQGSVISSNPVWNACIRSSYLSPALLRSNQDVYEHRQGRIRVRIPFSCRDYHRGDLRVWQFPDDPSVQLVLDKRGRLLGDPPPEYVLGGL